MPVVTSAKKSQGSKDKFIATIALLCVLIAGIVIYKVWASQQIQVAISIPGKVGSSEKGMAMKAMQDQKNAGQKTDAGAGAVDTDSFDPTKLKGK